MPATQRKIINRFEGFVMIVKESVTAYEKQILANGRAHHPKMVHELLRERALSEQVERMYVLGLDGQSNIMFIHEAARGGMHGLGVMARDLIRIPVMGGASSFVLVHNHPSGDPTPSVEDYAMTRQVRDAGKVIGVPLVDHVVIGSWDKFQSMVDIL